MAPPNEDAPRTVANVIEDAAVQNHRMAVRAEWSKYIFAAAVSISIALFGWLGNRAVGVLDRTESTVGELQGNLQSMRQYLELQTRQNMADLSGIRELLKDHEDRLRQDREVLVTHGTTIQNEASRILSLEQAQSLAVGATRAPGRR